MGPRGRMGGGADHLARHRPQPASWPFLLSLDRKSQPRLWGAGGGGAVRAQGTHSPGVPPRGSTWPGRGPASAPALWSGRCAERGCWPGSPPCSGGCDRPWGASGPAGVPARGLGRSCGERRERGSEVQGKLGWVRVRAAAAVPAPQAHGDLGPHFPLLANGRPARMGASETPRGLPCSGAGAG